MSLRPRAGRPSRLAGVLVSGLLLTGAVLTPATASAAPDSFWPLYKNPYLPTQLRVHDLMNRMTLDDKIGQMVQAERQAATPQQAADLRLGSILSGGGSVPTPNTPAAWADMYDSYQKAALATPLGIPTLYGVDAVHGHNNVHGATIFPHNVGLGAAHDPKLVEKIGKVTASEVRATGPTWNFAPCLCVSRDDRWGRAYESFGETPKDAIDNATVVNGLQGRSLKSKGSVLATAKHYVGDGGTTAGDDQGNTEISEAELRKIHLPPFKEAIQRGAGSVMISFSSWNGQKAHGHKYLITDVLKKELRFSGLVVSDWNGVHQLNGNNDDLTADEVRESVNAGIDLFMEPYDAPKFISLLRTEVDEGRVAGSRIDDANRRILTKKFESGLFEKPFADRSLQKDFGGAEHRAVAREAVKKSQVLLKNEGALPIKKGSKVFVAGKNADDIGNQSGGWTITWQGSSGPITTGTTILQGIQQVGGANTKVTYDREGDGADKSYDVAVAVVGETPYAEGVGDRPDGLKLDAEDLATIAKLKATGVSVVVVTVSGRPLDITSELPGWNALLAAWLPGTEGAGVADVLFGDHKPSGKLTFSWAQDFSQLPINVGDGKKALFPYGYGLTYKKK
ncbi:glycoside hydrolase family 3 protein [Amycolatopsis magusensis]|uniref:glycoside hydrolase family 3 protein n=1 Tax=Amycolatopsis magusensis TaxID=882444 RepID=UPI00378C5A45